MAPGHGDSGYPVAYRGPMRGALGVLAAGLVSCLAVGVPAPIAAAPIAAAPIAAAPVATAPVATLARFYAQSLTWRPCSTTEAQCARLLVPVDYARPDGPTVRLLVQRMPASGDRLGSLVINPGGPGVPGADWSSYLSYALPESLTSRYDLIGFDPRGVGASSALACFTPRTLQRYLAIDPMPGTPREVRALREQGGDIVRGCRNGSPGLWRHVSTDAVARDVDILRAALSEDRLDFLGFSYGTHIGAVYADLFPQRVGRMVLDGAMDPSLSALALGRQQARGFDHGIGRFLAWCVGRGNCPLGDTRTRATRELNALIEVVDRSGLPAPSMGSAARLTTASIVAALISATYTPQYGWPSLRLAVQEALNGDGSALYGMAESFALIGGDERSAAAIQSGLVAVTCSDVGRGPTYAEAMRAARKDARTFRIRALAYWGATALLSCSAWPEGTRPRPVRGPADRTILVIGTRHDTATPYVWSVRLAAQLRNARLLTVEADGHTSLLSNACSLRAATRYLLDGTLPASGRACPAT